MPFGRRTPAPGALTLVALASVSGLAACSCEGEPIVRSKTELRLTLGEPDPCSGTIITRRIPDDYDLAMLPKQTDFGSRGERVFLLRSTGSAPLTVDSISLVPPNPDFTLTATDSTGMAPRFPLLLAPNVDPDAAPGLTVKIAYQSHTSTAALTTLTIVSDDMKRQKIEFALTANRGQLQVCGTNGCDMPVLDFGSVAMGSSAEKDLTIKNTGDGDLDLRDIKLEAGSNVFCAPEATQLPAGSGCAQVKLCKTLAPGESYVVHVTYRPTGAAGTDSGDIQISSGAAVGR
jgi:hypothetical protein